ncbi:MAG: T3SS effector HopA1 family protein [Cyanobacteria bacterium J06632_19]
MDFFDSLFIQTTNESTKRLVDVLKDVVYRLEINSNFSIHHPDYKPYTISDDAVMHFQKMPENIQQKYLSLRLRNFLYGIYYNGSMQSYLKLNSEEHHTSPKFENNTFLGVDLEFYERLHQSNLGKGYFEPGWHILKEEVDGSLAVKKKDLRLHIKREKHLQPKHQAAVVGDYVAVKMPKNLVQNGFYVAVSNMGLYYSEISEEQPTIVRIYFHLTLEGAVTVMASLTKYFNELAIPGYFKVLYNPKDYERYDCGVLYFDKRDFQAVREVLQIVYQENKFYFKAEIPLFAKYLAPGLALAEESNKKFNSSESFGMNRCQVIANGLLDAWYRGDNSPSERIQSILNHFSITEIDLQSSYLNADSEDIYTQLNL